MQFSDLRTFLAVADLRSFSAAAAQLHITQPAASKRIQTLEQQLNVVLFDRVGKKVFLTPAGERLRPQAQQMLNLLQDTQHLLQNMDANVDGPLRIATSHHIGLHRLAPVLRAFTERFPQVQLNIQFEDSEVAHELVRQADIELAVVTLDPAGDTQLDSVEVWHDPLEFVSSQEAAEPLSLTQLSGLPSILPGIGTYTGRIVLQRFAEAGIKLSPSMSTNYLETIGMLVSVGLGWSVLPKSIRQNQPELTPLEVICEPMSRSLGYVTHPQRAKSNAASAFISVLREHAVPNLPAMAQ